MDASGERRFALNFVKIYLGLIAEVRHPAGRLNLATVATLVGIWVLFSIALLAELAFNVAVNTKWFRFSMGGEPWGIGVPWFIILLVWLAVTYLCVNVFYELNHPESTVEDAK